MNSSKVGTSLAVAVLVLSLALCSFIPSVLADRAESLPAFSESQSGETKPPQKPSQTTESTEKPVLPETPDEPVSPLPESYTVSFEQSEQSVPYATVKVSSDKLPLNFEKVMTSGENGKNLYTYEVHTYSDGRQYRFLSSMEVVKPVVNEIVHIGTSRFAPYNEFIYPTTGRLSSDFGYRTLNGERDFHYGIDIANKKGTKIVASDSGIVVTAARCSSYGKYVVIDHGNGFSTCYAHLSEISVTVGQEIMRGEQLGLMGNTGVSTGNHLHFEIRLGGTKVDPEKYLSDTLKNE